MEKKEYTMRFELEKEREALAYQKLQESEKKGFASKKEFIIQAIEEKGDRERLFNEIKKIVHETTEDILANRLSSFGRFD